MISSDSFRNEKAVNRLTALWALNESGLGGVLHAAKFPFTGILVGGFAVILIALIARYSDYSFKAIIKATGIVLIIKAAASPHSPFPAYLAVSFQGVLGALLFALTRNFKFTSVVFGGLALLESAIQKILLTVLFFGTSIWKSVDEFIISTLKIFQLPANFSFSEWIAISYVVLYFVLGLLIGRFTNQIPEAISSLDFSMITFSDTNHPVKQNRKKRKHLLLIAAFLILLSFQLLGVFEDWLFAQLLARVIFFMFLFYYVVGPLTTKLIQILSRNRSKEIEELNEEVANIRMAIRPVLSHVTKNYQGINRIKMFVLYMVAISLNDKIYDNE